MDAGVTAAALDVALEGALLRVVEDLAGGGEEDDDVERRQVGVGELRRVLGGHDGEAVGRADLLDRRDAGRDGVVPEAAGPREDEHAVEVGRLDRDRAGHPGVERAEEVVGAGGVERALDRGAVRTS